VLARSLLILMSALSCAGCAGTLLHVAADAKVTPEMQSAGNGGPLVPMSVPDNVPLERDAPLIVVLDVDGLLLNTDFTGLNSAGENPVSLFRERLDAISANPCVRGVVLRINSPGGGVTATDIMWHDLMRFKRCTRLPVVACLMDVGTGGAYYLATAADQIVAHPTSVTGGIGVILNLYNLQDALQQFNISGVPIKSGDKIDLGSPLKALDETKRKLLQKMADEFHDRFHEVVEQSRPDVDTNDKTTFDGRVFTAREALERHLIDSVGYLDDAICVARRMAHVHSAQVVLYHRQNDQARSPYALTPNVPLGTGLIPVSLPGYDRTKLPSFLYLWQPEPTMERLSGR
jgi:protease IV